MIAIKPICSQEPCPSKLVGTILGCAMSLLACVTPDAEEVRASTGSRIEANSPGEGVHADTITCMSTTLSTQDTCVPRDVLEARATDECLARGLAFQRLS